MSRSFMLRDGDFDVQGSVASPVSGTEKLIQDLDAWLRENYRVDRFHPRYGSVLDSFIGGVINDTLVSDIRTECIRVLSNFQQLQYQRFQEDPDKFTADELLDEVVSVTPTINYDTVYVSVKIQTAARQEVTFQARVGI